MPKIALNDAVVRSLAPGMYFDTKTPAFGIRVGKHRRTWIVLKGPKSAKVRLGHYPTVPLAQARKLALVHLGSAYAAGVPTYPDARDQYLANAKLSPRALSETKRMLTNYVHWTKKLDAITPDDILSAIEAIKAPSEALHCYKALRTFFNSCVPRYLKVSPLTGLKPPSKYVPRQRTLTDEEIKVVWTNATGSFGHLLKLSLLTGARKGELLNLKWSDIGVQDAVLPPSLRGENIVELKQA